MDLQEWIIERFGKFSRILNAGLNLIIPVADRIAKTISLKEIAKRIPSQPVITAGACRRSIDDERISLNFPQLFSNGLSSFPTISRVFMGFHFIFPFRQRDARHRRHIVLQSERPVQGLLRSQESGLCDRTDRDDDYEVSESRL